MRRLSLATTLVALFFSATSLAEYDEWYCNEGSEMLKLTGLACVSCGLQKYYREHGKGEVVPSEKFLSLLAVGARSFRELNPNSSERHAQNITRNDTAKQNLQKVVISQIQAYGFCTEYSSPNWREERQFITNDRNRAEDEVAGIAVNFGFDKSAFSKKPAYRGMKSLLDDSERNGSSLEDKRRAFYEIVDNDKVLAKGDKARGLDKCLAESRSRIERNDQQAHDICVEMAKACDIESTRFCVTRGMTLNQAPSTGRPAPPQAPGQRPLPPPPPPVR